jgi:hypothetical protein
LNEETETIDSAGDTTGMSLSFDNITQTEKRMRRQTKIGR